MFDPRRAVMTAGLDATMSDLTDKQARFVEEYLVDLNATQAAIRAGYSIDTARQIASENLSKPNIADAIAEAQAARSARTQITVDAVVAELGKLAFANMADFMRAGIDGDPYLDFSQLTRDQAAALVEVTVDDFKDGRGEDAREVRRVRFKLADKRAALVDLGRHLGMFVDRHEHTGKAGGPIAVENHQSVEAKRAEARRMVQEAFGKAAAQVRADA